MGFLIGCGLGVGIWILLESISNGITIRGTSSYDKFNKDSDARISSKLRNGSGSSKAELQEWWDTYHSS